VAEAAIELRDGVDDRQRDALCLPFDEEQRRTWFYWPAPRQGLALAALDASRRRLVHGLVTRLVSLPTYAKVTTIIALEEVLGELEAQGVLSRRRQTGLPRDSSNYYTTLFGEPGGADPWAVRFEGHHVSLHVTVAGSDVAVTPLFLGANPAEVSHDTRTVLRPLAEEEDVARALLDALPAAQRARAVIDDRAPDDIVTGNAPSVDEVLTGGVALADLSGTAADVARQLVSLYVTRSPAPVAEAVMAGLDATFGDLHFAWAGDRARHQPHYYRISGERFLAEYDNTQNGANHAHAVWRDPGGDFGTDLLRRHRHEAHEAGPHH
jgi:hypothetical protein